MLRNEEKQWELQVDHSLFAIEKLDVTVSFTGALIRVHVYLYYTVSVHSVIVSMCVRGKYM